ncbi:hypothetical protein [Streptomyces sp. URMC 129]|uniref:hypothetical protein n=1 Tax=Streptomyces sp. URMC 129 TaxID=3423407 RepID=UPI003F1B1F68
MARTAINATAVGAAGVLLPDVAAAAELTDGNSFVWAPNRRLYVSNGDSTALTVTVQTPGTAGTLGLAIADAPFTVAAGKARLLPKLGPEFRRPDGTVWLDYTGADASVTVAVLDL